MCVWVSVVARNQPQFKHYEVLLGRVVLRLLFHLSKLPCKVGPMFKRKVLSA